VDAIFRSWALLSPKSHQNLISKLSMRLPRALCHGIRAGSISSSFIDENRDMIEKIYSSARWRGMWKRWRDIDMEPIDRNTGSKEARARLARLPNMRKPL
jgi:hypothetical protein